MKLNRVFFLVLALSLLFYSAGLSELQAQFMTLQGQVKDAETGKGLPFVHLTINDGEAGTSSDLDGNFKLLIDIPVRKLVFSFIGYEPFVYEVNSPEDLKPLAKPLKIKLFSRSQALRELVIKAGDNPAHRIIKAAAKNRRKHQATRLKSYRYEAYHKFYVDLSEKVPEEQEVIAETKDSADIALEKHLEKHHLFLSESVSRKEYKAPFYTQETILANRISGFKNPQFMALSSAFEADIFYKDYIEFLDKEYLNPISNGSTEQYFFAIEDSILIRPDTIFIISFTPYPDKNFSALEGYLSIHSRDFALQYIKAKSIDAFALANFEIEQKFDYLEDRYWFPGQLKGIINFQDLALNDRKFRAVFRSDPKNIQLNPALKAREFDPATLEIQDGAHTKEPDFWEAYRGDALSKKDQNTYAYLDSLGQQLKFDRSLKLASTLALAKISWGQFDFDLNQALRYNRFEGLRLGLAVNTNAKFNSNFSLGSYLAYGFKDGRFKYGASADFFLEERYKLQAGLQYRDDVFEPGQFQFWEENTRLSQKSIRAILTERMHRSKSILAYVQAQPLPNTHLRVGLNSYSLQPFYEYTFLDLPRERASENLHFTELYVKLRWAWKERYLSWANERVYLGSEGPSINVNFYQGTEFLGGEFTYQKIEFKAQHQIRFRALGKSSFLFSGGWLSRTLPYPILFHGLGLRRNVPLFVDEHFQTMGLYEFLSDQNLNFFWTHNFGKLLYSSPWAFFQPELSIRQGFAWGDLRNSGRHIGLDFESLEKGYYESGFMLDNLLRFKYLDTVYWGVGFGAFFRYGPYAKENLWQNTFLKLSSRFSF